MTQWGSDLRYVGLCAVVGAFVSAWELGLTANLPRSRAAAGMQLFILTPHDQCYISCNGIGSEPHPGLLTVLSNLESRILNSS